ncbi:succinate dehydrogenase, hydrophobic membrane anchor protein [Temperatibacter marinus]|uniref:Succinate dehydrogenase hydrophobic membrane anchor subunit n=1 Tax=Temperatibacter marinus TaxID=1456591 RepID=A0AA52EG85_9PROT|nr:succinate dehydrogenase, hydrophobic membrane anchor protein [Temperatibacter marinus]WND01511.1 succinate dehydrogenase, hydrophobic membrane anchor protein [Temperatibacter marinus]
MTDMKAPLAKVRGLGSAKNGTHHWWMHRVTALANIPLVIFVVISFMGNLHKGYADWVAWLQQPVAAVVMVLFVANICYHMRLGLQVLIEDYVTNKTNKVAAMMAVSFGIILMAGLGIFSILKIAFGG